AGSNRRRPADRRMGPKTSRDHARRGRPGADVRAVPRRRALGRHTRLPLLPAGRTHGSRIGRMPVCHGNARALAAAEPVLPADQGAESWSMVQLAHLEAGGGFAESLLFGDQCGPATSWTAAIARFGGRWIL